MQTDAADGHKVDLADARFSQLYTADDFALDPTDPRYKATESAAAIQQQRAQARAQRDAGNKRDVPAAAPSGKAPAEGSAGGTPQLVMHFLSAASDDAAACRRPSSPRIKAFARQALLRQSDAVLRAAV